MVRQTYPLTLSQLMIWGAETVLVGGPPAHLCWMVELPPAPVAHWEEVVRQIASENEGLRLRVTLQDGEARQYVAPEAPAPLPVRDFTSSGGAEAMRRWVDAETRERLPLIDSPLFRFALLRVAGEGDRLFIKVHHLVADGWSMTVLTNQVHDRHAALETGAPLQEPPGASFVRYIAEQARPRPLERARFFMQGLLQRRMAPAAVRLRPDLPSVAQGPVERASYVLPAALRAEIDRWAESQHSSVYLFFLSVVLLYLALANEAEDAALGTIFHGRLDAAYRRTVGMFATVLLLRVAVAEPLRFSELCRRVQERWKGAIRGQPEQLSLEELEAVYDRLPDLLDVVVSYESHLPAETPEWLLAGIELGPVSLRIGLLDYASGRLEIEFLYRRAVFSAADIDALYQRMLRLAGILTANPERTVEALGREWRQV